jgi:hypothetical protein
MSSLRPLSLDDALKLGAAFSSAPSRAIGDKILPDGRVEADCFSGKQLADFLLSKEAGDMKVFYSRSRSTLLPPIAPCLPCCF